MSKSKNTEESSEKEFSLKQVELQMVQNMHDRSNSQLFDFFSFIAMERLAYTPTAHTSFRIEDGKLFIGETPGEEPKEEVATA